MTTSDDDIAFHFDDNLSPGETAQNDELFVTQRSWLATSAVAVCVAGLVVLVISSGSTGIENEPDTPSPSPMSPIGPAGSGRRCDSDRAVER